MNPRGGLRLVVLLYIGALTLIAWFSVTREREIPPPAKFVSATALYGFFAIVSEFSPEFGLALAGAWSLALIYAVSSQSDPARPVAALRGEGAVVSPQLGRNIREEQRQL